MAKETYKVAMKQRFYGEVESIQGNKVIINFEVNDESEPREFSRRRLENNLGRRLQEGDAMEVYFELRAIEPRPPMTPKECAAWKRKNAWMYRLQKRTKTAKTLISED